MTAHAKIFGASNAHRWMNCLASPKREEGLPNTSSPHADWGTACHTLSATCLLDGSNPIDHLGVIDKEVGIAYEQELCDTATAYVEFVRHLVETTGGKLYVEQRVDYRDWMPPMVGDDDGFGTADTAIVTDDELIVVDLKGGAGISVSVKSNKQLRLYALGTHAEFGMLYDYSQVRMVIVQPRNGGIKEEVISLDELLAFGEEVRAVATRILTEENLPAAPSEDTCKFCKAKATCPELQAEVLATVFGDDLDEPRAPATPELPAVWSKLKLIESWCDGIRERMLLEVRAGSIPEFKIVQGKRGPRRWRSVDEATETLKAMRLKREEMFDMKLISPTTAEKLLKEKPRSWAKVLPLIEQPPGNDTVVPLADPRPAISASDDAFTDLTKEVAP